MLSKTDLELIHNLGSRPRDLTPTTITVAITNTLLRIYILLSVLKNQN